MPVPLHLSINTLSIMRHIPTTFSRPLHVDLDEYTCGDQSFKYELTALIRNDINELQHALLTSVEKNEPQAFYKVSHRVYTSLSVLNDRELIAVIEDLKNDFTKSENVIFHKKVAEMNRMCEGIKISLNQVMGEA